MNFALAGNRSLSFSMSERLKNFHGAFWGPCSSIRYLITPLLHHSIKVGLEIGCFSAMILRASFSLISFVFMPLIVTGGRGKRQGDILYSFLLTIYPYPIRIRG